MLYLILDFLNLTVQCVTMRKEVLKSLNISKLFCKRYRDQIKKNIHNLILINKHYRKLITILTALMLLLQLTLFMLHGGYVVHSSTACPEYWSSCSSETQLFMKPFCYLYFKYSTT